MSARRILVVLAVVMGVTALSVAVAPPPSTNVQDAAKPSTSGSSGAPGLDADVLERTLSSDAPEAETIEVPLGSTLRLSVEAQTLDGVEIEGLELFAGVAPDTPAMFEWLADRPGSFPVRLLESGRLVGTIEVSLRS